MLVKLIARILGYKGRDLDGCGFLFVQFIVFCLAFGVCLWCVLG